jgi:hypothetical protein
MAVVGVRIAAMTPTLARIRIAWPGLMFFIADYQVADTYD